MLKRDKLLRNNLITHTDVMEEYSKKHPGEVVLFICSNDPEGKNIYELLGWGRFRVNYLIMFFDKIEKACKYVENEVPRVDFIDTLIYKDGKFILSMNR